MPSALPERAVALHRTGRPADAEAACQQMLARDPHDPHALLLLAELLLARGDAAGAAALFGRAINRNPTAASLHLGLGEALRALDRHDEAAASFRHALQLAPDRAEAHAALGACLMALGAPADAADAFRAALHLQPRVAVHASNLGIALKRLGRHAEAIEVQFRAVRIEPNLALPHYNLANSLREAGRHEEAVAAYREALRRQPVLADAHCNLGNTLVELGQAAAAIEAFEAAIRAAPVPAPASVPARLGLGIARAALGQLGSALDCFDAVLRLAPGSARAHGNRGNVLLDMGEAAAADRAYHEAVRLAPHSPDAYCNLQMSLHYQPELPDRVRVDRLRAFADRFEPAGPDLAGPDLAGPDPAGLPDAAAVDPGAGDPPRLRIGYVSGDLGNHPVGRFLRPVLAAHDRTRVTVFCYANARHDDAVARSLRAHADHWREVATLSDAALAERVRQDGIDILVDLSGHTARNRLPVFAARAAPVQATWLGYWDGTGLSRMDAILSDAATIPPGEEARYRERVVRLPHGRFCFEPPENAPAVRPPPCSTTGTVTFGSFNNLAKLGPEVVRAWARILEAVPGSRLVLKWKSLADPRTRARITEAFAATGLDPARLVLRGASPLRDMLAEYGDIDLALDPFPFPGGMTSCDALWMGVPVVTLPGERPVSRQTAGFLRMIGLDALVAGSLADYEARAIALARDPDRLAGLRAELRDRLRRSALCDAAGFTAGLEAAYRMLWRDRRIIR